MGNHRAGQGAVHGLPHQDFLTMGHIGSSIGKHGYHFPFQLPGYVFIQLFPGLYLHGKSHPKGLELVSLQHGKSLHYIPAGGNKTVHGIITGRKRGGGNSQGSAFIDLLDHSGRQGHDALHLNHLLLTRGGGSGG